MAISHGHVLLGHGNTGVLLKKNAPLQTSAHRHPLNTSDLDQVPTPSAFGTNFAFIKLGYNIKPGKHSDTRIKTLLPLVSGYGHYTTATPERTPVSVG
jgi:hypothetical protein